MAAAEKGDTAKVARVLDAGVPVDATNWVVSFNF
jgi:hypothetical protein